MNSLRSVPGGGEPVFGEIELQLVLKTGDAPVSVHHGGAGQESAAVTNALGAENDDDVRLPGRGQARDGRAQDRS